MRIPRLSTYALALTALIGNVIVILQGAVVRATGSGAGCGSHWPTCHGDFVPLGAGVETAIEFSHRLLSLAVLTIGAWLLVRVWKVGKERPGLRFFGVAAFAFLIVEALLGAATVLFGLTGDNVSTARGLMVAIHMVNSLLLAGTLTGTVVYARKNPPSWPLRLADQPLLSIVVGFGLVAMLGLIFTGGIAAMGNTMFPSETLADGIAADFDPESHPLIRLRILHPLIAISVGVYLLLSLGLAWWLKPVEQARPFARGLLTVYMVQIGVGFLNLALLAPIVLQILHLFLAVAAFGLFTATGVTALGNPAGTRATRKTPVSLENF